MTPPRDENPGTESSSAGPEAETEYLDLDGDGVPDAVRTTETVEYETDSGAEVVEEVREVDAGIGADGVPTTVTVTDTVAIDADHDGVPDAAEVIEVTVHPDAPPETP